MGETQKKNVPQEWYGNLLVLNKHQHPPEEQKISKYTFKYIILYLNRESDSFG